MHPFKISVLSDHAYPAFETRHPEYESAKLTLADLMEMMIDENGHFTDEWTFDGGDVIMLHGPDGHLLSVWNRAEPLKVEEFAHVDPESKDGGLVGWQIGDPEGWSVQGDVEDPFGLASYHILTEGAATTVRAWAEANGHVMCPIFSGDVEEPEIVFDLGPAHPAPQR